MRDNNTNKMLYGLLVCICLSMCCGCNLLENLTDDINGWDLSACVDGFSTCWELFTDNAEKFEDGFVDAMDAITVP